VKLIQVKKLPLDWVKLDTETLPDRIGAFTKSIDSGVP